MPNFRSARGTPFERSIVGVSLPCYSSNLRRNFLIVLFDACAASNVVATIWEFPRHDLLDNCQSTLCTLACGFVVLTTAPYLSILGTRALELALRIGTNFRPPLYFG